MKVQLSESYAQYIDDAVGSTAALAERLAEVRRWESIGAEVTDAEIIAEAVYVTQVCDEAANAERVWTGERADSMQQDDDAWRSEPLPAKRDTAWMDDDGMLWA